MAIGEDSLHNCSQQDRHTLHPFGSSYSNVPQQMLSFSHHNDQSLVQQRFPALILETGQGIQPQRFPKNANPHVSQAAPPTVSHLDPMPQQESM